MLKDTSRLPSHNDVKTGTPVIANTNSDGNWDGWDTEGWGDMDQHLIGMVSSTESNQNSTKNRQSDQWMTIEEKMVRSIK